MSEKVFGSERLIPIETVGGVKASWSGMELTPVIPDEETGDFVIGDQAWFLTPSPQPYFRNYIIPVRSPAVIRYDGVKPLNWHRPIRPRSTPENANPSILLDPGFEEDLDQLMISLGVSTEVALTIRVKVTYGGEVISGSIREVPAGWGMERLMWGGRKLASIPLAIEKLKTSDLDKLEIELSVTDHSTDIITFPWCYIRPVIECRYWYERPPTNQDGLMDPELESNLPPVKEPWVQGPLLPGLQRGHNSWYWGPAAGRYMARMLFNYEERKTRVDIALAAVNGYSVVGISRLDFDPGYWFMDFGDIAPVHATLPRDTVNAYYNLPWPKDKKQVQQTFIIWQAWLAKGTSVASLGFNHVATFIKPKEQ
jgi:hypothetical protein